MFYVQRDGIEHGPVSGEQLKRMVADGRLQRTDKLRKADDTVWHSAGKVKSLFPDTQLAPISAASIPAPSALRTVEVLPTQVTIFQPTPTEFQPIPTQLPNLQFALPQAIHLPIALAVPQPMTVASPVLPALDVLCPFCQEQIKREAKKCKHCGEILDVVLRQSMAPQPQLQPQMAAPVIHINNVNNNENVGYRGRTYQAWSPLLAMFLSLILPGLGQLYKGQALNGIAWFIAVLIGYFLLVIPGLILHLCCIIGAGTCSPYRIE